MSYCPVLRCASICPCFAHSVELEPTEAAQEQDELIWRKSGIWSSLDSGTTIGSANMCIPWVSRQQTRSTTSEILLAKGDKAWHRSQPDLGPQKPHFVSKLSKILDKAQKLAQSERPMLLHTLGDHGVCPKLIDGGVTSMGTFIVWWNILPGGNLQTNRKAISNEKNQDVFQGAHEDSLYLCWDLSSFPLRASWY